MRLKQKMALLLTGVMLAGSIGMINPMEVEAAPKPTTSFTLYVPGDTNITKSGWNNIGNVGVSNVSIDIGNTIEVTIEGGATGRTLKKSGDTSKTVGYDIYKGSTSRGDEFGDKLEFTENGTQAIGAEVEDFSGKEDGTYTDTINFTATLKEGISAENFPLSNSNAKVLRASDLLASKTAEASTYSTFTYNSTTYTAYNGYIDDTAYANWDEAQSFVKLLNDNAVDGCTTWTLLTDADMAFKWWQSTAESGQQHNTTNIKYGQSSFGGVDVLWSGAESGSGGCYWDCGYAMGSAEYGFPADDVKSGAWNPSDKTDSDSNIGFVVLRESESSESTGVEYELTGTNSEGRVLDSDVLLQIADTSEFTYKGTKYTAYNGFVGQTKGANFADAQNFIEELNKVELDGRKGGWTLLEDANMAYKWWLSTDSNKKEFGLEYIDGVSGVWTSADSGSNGYAWICDVAWEKADEGEPADEVKSNAWNWPSKNTSESVLGFVVLRNDGETPQTLEAYNLENGGTISVDNLGSPSPSDFKYERGYYKPYNDFISYTAGASWNDAMGFVELLNDNEYEGNSDWMLLDEGESAQMVYQWWQSTAESDATNTNLVKTGKGAFGNVASVWLASDFRNEGYYWNCRVAYDMAAEDSGDFADVINTSVGQLVKSGGGYSNFGFVIICPTDE